MTSFVFAVNPIIEMVGQISAVIICLFMFVFVIIALAFNAAASFGTAWVREKTQLIKLLRPYVDSVNKASATSSETMEPSTSENPVARSVSIIPAKVNAANQKVDETGDRVANAVIEFRARALQAKTIAKAFFLPGLMKTEPRPVADEEGLEFNTPGYRTLVEKEKVPLSEEEPMTQVQGYRGRVTRDR